MSGLVCLCMTWERDSTYKAREHLRLEIKVGIFLSNVLLPIDPSEFSSCSVIVPLFHWWYPLNAKFRCVRSPQVRWGVKLLLPEYWIILCTEDKGKCDGVDIDGLCISVSIPFDLLYAIMTYFTRATLSKGVIAHVRHCLTLPQYFRGLCFRYGQENFTLLFKSSGGDNSFLCRFGSRSRPSSSSPRSSFLFCFSCAGLLVLFPEAPDFELDEDVELEDLFSAWPPASVLS